MDSIQPESKICKFTQVKILKTEDKWSSGLLHLQVVWIYPVIFLKNNNKNMKKQQLTSNSWFWCYQAGLKEEVGRPATGPKTLDWGQTVNSAFYFFVVTYLFIYFDMFSFLPRFLI